MSHSPDARPRLTESKLRIKNTEVRVRDTGLLFLCFSSAVRSWWFAAQLPPSSLILSSALIYPKSTQWALRWVTRIFFFWIPENLFRVLWFLIPAHFWAWFCLLRDSKSDDAGPRLLTLVSGAPVVLFLVSPTPVSAHSWWYFCGVCLPLTVSWAQQGLFVFKCWRRPFEASDGTVFL